MLLIRNVFNTSGISYFGCEVPRGIELLTLDAEMILKQGPCRVSMWCLSLSHLWSFVRDSV